MTAGSSLYRKSGVAIAVIQVIVLKLLHQFLQLAVVVAELGQPALAACDLVGALGRGRPPGLSCAADVHVEPDVDPLVLEALDPPVEVVEGPGVQAAGGRWHCVPKTLGSTQSESWWWMRMRL